METNLTYQHLFKLKVFIIDKKVVRVIRIEAIVLREGKRVMQAFPY